MKQNYTILFFMFFIFLFTGCANKESEQLTHKLDTAIAIGENQPNEALQILDSIAPENLDKKNFMLYQVAKVKALRNANLPIDSALTRRISQSANYFEEQNDAKNAAIANFYAGRAYQYKNDTGTEFAYYLKAYPYAEKANDSTTMGKTLFNIGCLYYDQQIYDLSAKYLLESIPILMKYPLKQAEAYRLLSSTSVLVGDMDKGIKYMNEGLLSLNKLQKQKENNIYYYSYNVLRGRNYKYLGEYDKSVVYLWENLKPEVPKIEQIRSALNLVDLYRLTQNTDSATYYARLVEPELQNIEPKTLDDNYLLSFGYRVMRDYYTLVNKRDEIIHYNRLDIEKQRQIDKENISSELSFIKNKLMIERIEDLNKEQKSKFITYTILISVLIIFTAFILMLKYIKRDETKAINEKMREIETLRNRLNAMKKDQDLE